MSQSFLNTKAENTLIVKNQLSPCLKKSYFINYPFTDHRKGLHLLCTFKNLLYFLYVDVVEQAVFFRPESLESVPHFLFLSFDDWFRQPAITCCYKVIEKLTNDYIFVIFLCNGLLMCSKKNCVSLQIKYFTEIPGLPVGSEFLLFHPVDPEASTSLGPGRFLRCNQTKPILPEEVLGGNFFFLKFSISKNYNFLPWKFSQTNSKIATFLFCKNI